MRKIKFEFISTVKEIKETTDITEVNKLIQENWILLQIIPNKEPVYSLGRLGKTCLSGTHEASAQEQLIQNVLGIIKTELLKVNLPEFPMKYIKVILDYGYKCFVIKIPYSSFNERR